MEKVVEFIFFCNFMDIDSEVKTIKKEVYYGIFMQSMQGAS